MHHLRMAVTLAVLAAAGYTPALFAQESLRWGSRNWGESVWGVLPVSVPTLAFAGMAILVTLIVLVMLMPKNRGVLKRNR